MPETTYEGSCHCGAVRYQVTMPAPGKGMACNCSICSRAGWLLAFVGGDSFRLLSGEDALVDYQFGRKHLHHTFCRTCGVHPFTTGTDKSGKKTVAVNLRCLTGVDPTKLQVEIFDGASVPI